MASNQMAPFHATLLPAAKFPGLVGEVTCSALYEGYLYVGTNRGVVLKYVKPEASTDKDGGECQDGPLSLVGKRDLSKYQLGAIRALVMCDGLKKAIVQCSASLLLLRLPTLHVDFTSPELYPSTMKGVVGFSCDDMAMAGHDNEPTTVSLGITVAKNRSLYNFELSKTLLTVESEIALSSTVRALGRMHGHVCVALKNEYRLVAIATGKQTQVCAFDDKLGSPVVLPLSKAQSSADQSEDEFMLLITTSSTTTLGVFIGVQGRVSRPNLTLEGCPSHVTFNFPYVAAAIGPYIEVHSIIDSQRHQRMKCIIGSHPGYADHGLVWSSANQVILLKQKPLTTQVSGLLEAGRINEALLLVEAVAHARPSDPSHGQLHQKLLEHVADSHMERGQIVQALDCYERAETNLVKVLEYFELIGGHEAEKRGVGRRGLVERLGRGRPRLVQQAYQDLTGYLERIKKTPVAEGKEETVQRALLISYALLGNPALLAVVEKTTSVSLEEAEAILLKYERYHALALLYARRGKEVKALGVWRGLAQGDTHDKDFPGLPYIARYLSTLTNHVIVLNALQWLGPLMPGVAAKVLCDLMERQPMVMRPENILANLNNCSSLVRWIFMENVVYNSLPGLKEMPIKTRQLIHSQLARLYIDMISAVIGAASGEAAQTVTRLMAMESAQDKHIVNLPQPMNSLIEPMKEGHRVTVSEEALPLVAAIRKRLLTFLYWSTLYNSEEILLLLEKEKLLQEAMIVHMKTGRHTEALQILINELNNWSAVPLYTHLAKKGNGYGEKDGETLRGPQRETEGEPERKTERERERQRAWDVHGALLAVCLRDVDPKSSSLDERVLNELNQSGALVDPVKTLQQLPPSLPLSSIFPFLRTALRSTASTQRELAIGSGLARAQHTKTQWELVAQRAQHGPVAISNACNCAVCLLPLPATSIAFTPAGSVCHAQCLSLSAAHGDRA